MYNYYHGHHDWSFDFGDFASGAHAHTHTHQGSCEGRKKAESC